MKKDYMKNFLFLMLIVLALFVVFNSFGSKPKQQHKMSYSQFLNTVREGKVTSVTITDQNVTGITQNNKTFSTYIPFSDPYLISDLLKQDINIVGKPPQRKSVWLQTFITWLPLLLIFGVWFFLMRQQMGGKGSPFTFGRSRARLSNNGQAKITFADVAGCEEAKEEVSELVDFLRDPSKFQKLGGRIPRGFLLIGPPGTGKTLLAKAVAGEANVPFFSISGSDFVEMFVGVGASRVRDMFEQAKKQAPCIIFIDELDAVGRHRGAGLGGGHDEREQTLNQLLVEMDGFEGTEGVIVVAATNRPDVLDPALLRPGRFDRQVIVPLPDIRGREQILEVHVRKVAMDDDVKIARLARGTPGFSGADLANLVNEAALIAARRNKLKVSMAELEKAKDKIMMGAERRSLVMSEEEKTMTAYHEAGHAIVGRLVPEHDPVYKVTIIPRGRALGVTMFLPEKDRYSISKMHIESQIAGMFGGRVAEAMIFGPEQITTGASNDIKQATQLARNMVTKWGLSEKLGPLLYDESGEEIFLGHTLATKHKELSDHTSRLIDEEVRTIIDRNYVKAENILKAHREALENMAQALMKYETIDENQIEDVMAGRPVKPPEDFEEDLLKPEDRQQGGQASATADQPKIPPDAPQEIVHHETLGDPMHAFTQDMLKLYKKPVGEDDSSQQGGQPEKGDEPASAQTGASDNTEGESK